MRLHHEQISNSLTAALEGPAMAPLGLIMLIVCLLVIRAGYRRWRQSGSPGPGR